MPTITLFIYNINFTPLIIIRLHGGKGKEGGLTDVVNDDDDEA